MTRSPHTPAGPTTTPWAALAAHWQLLGPPLRPVAEDIARLTAAWQAARGAEPAEPLAVLLLGVTPEYAQHAWAPRQELVAVDSSETMIRVVWPGDIPGRRALVADWLQLPFPDASFDLILCDNGPALFNSLERLEAFGRELRRVVRPTGCAAIRNLERPARTEPVEAAVADVLAGRVDNFHAFKMRFLMALQGAHPDPGIELGAAWEQFNRLLPDRAQLAARIGCSARVIATIDAYRGRAARYSFYNAAEITRGFAGFRVVPGPAGRYPFAERCPVFALAPAP